MKKLSILLLIIFATFSLFACMGKEDNSAKTIDNFTENQSIDVIQNSTESNGNSTVFAGENLNSEGNIPQNLTGSEQNNANNNQNSTENGQNNANGGQNTTQSEQNNANGGQNTTQSEQNNANGEQNTSNKTVYIQSKVDSLCVRTGKGTNYSSLGTLDKGDMLTYLGEEGGWYKTVFRNQNAYVSAKYAVLYYMEKADEDVEKIISEGLRLLGTPYVYGAVRYCDGNGNKLRNFTDKEFDCSSLMQYIFMKGAGKLLNVTTRTQILQGEKNVTLRRGDLMFFTNASRKNNVGIERVGHVALYLGNNYILHTASDHAVIEEISPTRWSYFIQANRL